MVGDCWGEVFVQFVLLLLRFLGLSPPTAQMIGDLDEPLPRFKDNLSKTNGGEPAERGGKYRADSRSLGDRAAQSARNLHAELFAHECRAFPRLQRALLDVIKSLLRDALHLLKLRPELARFDVDILKRFRSSGVIDFNDDLSDGSHGLVPSLRRSRALAIVAGLVPFIFEPHSASFAGRMRAIEFGAGARDRLHPPQFRHVQREAQLNGHAQDRLEFHEISNPSVIALGQTAFPSARSKNLTRIG